MKLARELAELSREAFRWINADGYTDEELEETVEELTEVITIKLKPIQRVMTLIVETKKLMALFED